MPEHIYDKGYKRVLSKKEYFLHFVKKYIRVNWIQNIQPEDLNLINANFVDEAFQEREADIVYKAKNGDQDVYFYVLLEAAIHRGLHHAFPPVGLYGRTAQTGIYKHTKRDSREKGIPFACGGSHRLVQWQ